MFNAHGATVEVEPGFVVGHRSALAAALSGEDSFRISLADATGVDVHEPTALLPGRVRVLGTGADIAVAPNQQAVARDLAEAISAALRGETAEVGVDGLDFVAVDVETANSRWGSICQVGASRFRHGQLAAQREWWCRPPAGIDSFDEANVAIHGITADAVADQPRFGEILDDVVAFVGDDVVIAHNAQFDASAIRDAAQASGLAAPSWRFGCTLALARARRLDVANHRLPTLAAHFGIEQTAHHDAGDDAVVAGRLLVALARDRGYAGSTEKLFDADSLNLGELSDRLVTPVSVHRTRPAPAAATPATPSPAWRKVATPTTVPEANPNADPHHPLFGHNVTLTGDFDPLDKGELWERIAECGATIGKNVTKKTTILVAGAWKTTTSKEKKAREYIDKGQNIEIWSATQLIAALDSAGAASR
ncbi:exonuclease domain-containing protein [Corynebacterium uterequi]|uniref:DNA polymerase III epsilon subunit-like 3'-5' exonuclease n=1 Tax=Corynebacterium uterequi TaxID=1072256 RepID=A0A0G3HJW9_9CORY|nr:exonuclease domain-containing protein [Corynebacterium uterequi]AKK11427.1 DNA polymerase III epsilon subunit-like 3'-5' exonuclease [Corynebacterium uterequi]